MEDKIIEFLENDGFKKIKNTDMEDISGYYIDKEGTVVRIISKKIKEKFVYSIKEVPISKGNGGYKTNIMEGKNIKCKQIHDLIYRAFKGDYEGNLIFLDGNKYNYNLENLVTMKELIEVYKEVKKC